MFFSTINIKLIMMNIFDNYYNTKLELDSFKKRLNLISEYQRKFRKEKRQLKKIIEIQEKILYQIERDLKDLTGIKNKIYYEIIINGVTVTKAIDKVAIELEKDSSTLWKYYYPDVKKRITELKLLFCDKSKENLKDDKEGK